MTGAFLNAIGILLGGLAGLAIRQPLSWRRQIFFRSAVGAATVFFGLHLVWLSVNGDFPSCLKQIFIGLLAIALGNGLGKLLRLQKLSNRLGRFAGNLIIKVQSNGPCPPGDGFKACAILFCAAPLGLLGAVADGLAGYFYLLAIKAVMDGLAMAGFVKIFGWPAALSAFPVFAFLGGIALTGRFYVKPFLDSHHLTGFVSLTAGLAAGIVALVIFEVRKVELANFLPGLILAPFLAWLWR